MPKFALHAQCVKICAFLICQNLVYMHNMQKFALFQYAKICSFTQYAKIFSFCTICQKLLFLHNMPKFSLFAQYAKIFSFCTLCQNFLFLHSMPKFALHAKYAKIFSFCTICKIFLFLYNMQNFTVKEIRQKNYTKNKQPKCSWIHPRLKINVKGNGATFSTFTGQSLLTCVPGYPVQGWLWNATLNIYNLIKPVELPGVARLILKTKYSH